MTSGKRVLLAMSGGVDSSTAAVLLLEQGYAVTGITMRLWTESDSACGTLSDENEQSGKSCCSADDIRDAQMAAARLNIPHYVLNYRDLFRREVVQPFIADYQNGLTPNPCLLCNQKIKFDYLIKHAVAMGFDFIATGHYAQIGLDTLNGQMQLLRGADRVKDQSYFLYGLDQDQLKRLLFPLGLYQKKEIRQIAEAHGLANARKNDSQEICFIDSKEGYRTFLDQHNIESKPDYFVDCEGKVLGKHKGIANYTIGQRKKLGQAFGQRLFVIRIDPESNRITLGSERDLYAASLLADKVLLSSRNGIERPVAITAKIRSQSQPAQAVLIPLAEDRVQVIFTEPQRAITPGQAVVFYQDEIVLGGGRITGSSSESLSDTFSL